ncbi:MAG: hypothetical protein EXS16_09730 [Gemmataceae bacterium]|nr:hypothetical protein [Gemmataceae bacterium]
MSTLSITLPEAMKAHLERQVGPGRFTDVSAYIQSLIEEAMDDNAIAFSPSQRERIDALLLESVESFSRGEHTELHPSEFEDLARRMVEEHKGCQAS